MTALHKYNNTIIHNLDKHTYIYNIHISINVSIVINTNAFMTQVIISNNDDYKSDNN